MDQTQQGLGDQHLQEQRSEHLREQEIEHLQEPVDKTQQELESKNLDNGGVLWSTARDWNLR